MRKTKKLENVEFMLLRIGMNPHLCICNNLFSFILFLFFIFLFFSLFSFLIKPQEATDFFHKKLFGNKCLLEKKV